MLVELPFIIFPAPLLCHGRLFNQSGWSSKSIKGANVCVASCRSFISATDCRNTAIDNSHGHSACLHQSFAGTCASAGMHMSFVPAGSVALDVQVLELAPFGVHSFVPACHCRHSCLRQVQVMPILSDAGLLRLHSRPKTCVSASSSCWLPGCREENGLAPPGLHSPQGPVTVRQPPVAGSLGRPVPPGAVEFSRPRAPAVIRGPPPR